VLSFLGASDSSRVQTKPKSAIAAPVGSLSLDALLEQAETIASTRSPKPVSNPYEYDPNNVTTAAVSVSSAAAPTVKSTSSQSSSAALVTKFSMSQLSMAPAPVSPDSGRIGGNITTPSFAAELESAFGSSAVAVNEVDNCEPVEEHDV
jgi:hypothetical protein